MKQNWTYWGAVSQEMANVRRGSSAKFQRVSNAKQMQHVQSSSQQTQSLQNQATDNAFDRVRRPEQGPAQHEVKRAKTHRLARQLNCGEAVPQSSANPSARHCNLSSQIEGHVAIHEVDQRCLSRSPTTSTIPKLPGTGATKTIGRRRAGRGGCATVRHWVYLAQSQI